MVTVGEENQGYHLHRMTQNGGFHNLFLFYLPEEFHADRPYPFSVVMLFSLCLHNIWCTASDKHGHCADIQTDLVLCYSHLMCNVGKGSYAISEQWRPRSACTSVLADLGILWSSTYSTISIEFVSRQRKPWSACWSGPALSAKWIRALFVRFASYGTKGCFHTGCASIIDMKSPMRNKCLLDTC